MDFRNRVAPSASHAHNGGTAATPQQVPAAPAQQPVKQPNKQFGGSKWARVVLVVLLFSLTIVTVGIVALFHYANPNEYKYVATSKYQAVFLANEQVYFGKVKAVTSRYVDLQDIFYLNNQNGQGASSSNSSSTNLSLVKLGCEVHGPYDEMVINRSQILFWENLRDNGQVATAIGKWISQNPNGQTCSTTSSSTNQASGSNSSPSNSSTTTNSSSASNSTSKQ